MNVKAPEQSVWLGGGLVKDTTTEEHTMLFVITERIPPIISQFPFYA